METTTPAYASAEFTEAIAERTMADRQPGGIATARAACDERLERLDRAVSVLLERLEPIQRGPSDLVAAVPRQSLPDATSQLSAVVIAYAEHIERLTDRLTEATERVDL